jgi:5'(3')-deoxyribonucleotidase
MIRSPANGKFIFVLDLDDVVNNLCNHWIALYNSKYSENLKIEDIKSWDIGKYTKIGNEMYDLLGYPGLFKNLDIQPDCYDVLKWANDFFDPQIVSASSYITYADKAEWVIEKLPFIPIDSFSSMHNKFLLSGAIMLDDKSDNLKHFDGEKIIYTRPWNENYYYKKRADNWKQVKVMLQDYLERNK